jgi:hypothetical protein
MILDFSHRPIKVVIDDCVKSIVVRSMSSPDADGLVRRWEESKGGKRWPEEVAPTVRMPRGGVTCFETRLPLLHIQPRTPKRGKYAATESLPVLPSPFEVVSFYKDNLTEKSGTWRLNIIIELHTNRRQWFVTVQDETNSLALATVMVKDLETSPAYQESTPLQRFIRTEGRPVSAWDRIMEDD